MIFIVGPNHQYTHGTQLFLIKPSRLGSTANITIATVFSHIHLVQILRGSEFVTTKIYKVLMLDFHLVADKTREIMCQICLYVLHRLRFRSFFHGLIISQTIIFFLINRQAKFVASLSTKNYKEVSFGQPCILKPSVKLKQSPACQLSPAVSTQTDAPCFRLFPQTAIFGARDGAAVTSMTCRNRQCRPATNMTGGKDRRF